MRYENDVALWNTVKLSKKSDDGKAYVGVSGKDQWYFCTPTLRTIQKWSSNLGGILEAFEALPQAERKPKVTVGDRGKPVGVEFLHGPIAAQRPEGAMVLRRGFRVLKREKGHFALAKWPKSPSYGLFSILGVSEREAKRERPATAWPAEKEGWTAPNPSVDLLWVPPTEWKALLPADVKPGESYPVPAAFQARLLCTGLVCTLGRHGQPFWDPKHVREAALKLTIRSATAKEIVLHLQGSAALERDGWGHNDKGWPSRQDVGVLGVFSYDRQKKLFTRCDVTAVGDYAGLWGDYGDFNMQAQPRGWFFELATGEWPLDHMAPSGVVEQLRFSLKD
jgi:hypothetical protein